MPGYELYRTSAVVKPHSYKTRRGEPGLGLDAKGTYSQFVFGVWTRRPGYGFYFKLFQGLFAAVGIALLAFAVKPTHVDPRFGLGVGAFFAAVANGYLAASLVPDTGVLTLTDVVNGIGAATIFLTLVQSVVSLRIYEGRGGPPLSRLFDRVSVGVIATAYLALNLALPRAAML